MDPCSFSRLSSHSLSALSQRLLDSSVLAVCRPLHTLLGSATRQWQNQKITSKTQWFCLSQVDMQYPRLSLAHPV